MVTLLYYANTHGIERLSYDGDDSPIRLYVDVNIPTPNARWRPCGNLIEFSPGFMAQDLVGHEFTHGVVNHEFNPPYEDQPGALDESLADTFGQFIEAYATGATDWLVSANMTGGGGPLRNMAQPSVRPFFDPDNMDPNRSTDGRGLRLRNGQPVECDSNRPNYNDCGFVHTNSGILNKAAWLISNGADNTFNGITVHGLSIAVAEQIFYHAVTGQHLRGSKQFIDMREAMIESAEALYGANSPDVCTVRNAYAAVGLGEADRDCDGIEDPSDTDDDGDSVLDSHDNCRFIANLGQVDSDRDGRGDACDTDMDGDGVVNGEDNCMHVANPTQLDTDGDGVGEACDEEEQIPDGIPNRHADDTPWDNCPGVSNADQANHDGGSLGDACDPDDDNDGILDDGDHSGVAGDNYCHGGDTTNCDDNAPFNPNPTQPDADDDGVGDVVDICQGTYSPYAPGVYPPVQPDTDRDGLGDACDPDIDNDGIPNLNDNCVYQPNFDQADINNNGVGLRCDGDEAFMLSAQARLVSFFIKFRDRSPVVLPIFPCWADGCPDTNSTLPDGQRAFVSLNMSKAFGVRITDDAGSLIKRDRTGTLNKSLSFGVHPSYRFDFNSMGIGSKVTDLRRTDSVSDTIRYAQRPMYFLELWPTADTVIGQSYRVQFNLISFAPTHQVHLPIVVR